MIAKAREEKPPLLCFASLRDIRDLRVNERLPGPANHSSAVGVSGATSAQDEQVAATAIAAVIKP
jgi:hypothetical protein